MDFLLDDDCIEVEPDTSEAIERYSMAEASARLLWRLNEVRGIPNPVPAKRGGPPIAVPAKQWTAPATPQLWPSWYRPPGIHRKTGNELLRSVAHDFGITVDELRGKGRETRLIDARAVVTRILRDRGMSYPQIGRVLGHSDHSSAINSVAKFAYYCARNPDVERSYQRHRAQDAAA